MPLEFKTGLPCTSCGEYVYVMLDHFQNVKWSMAGRTRADHFFPFLKSDDQRFLNDRVCPKCVKANDGN